MHDPSSRARQFTIQELLLLLTTVTAVGFSIVIGAGPAVGAILLSVIVASLFLVYIGGKGALLVGLLMLPFAPIPCGYLMGCLEAEQELASGKPTIYVCGHLSCFLGNDPQTGLPTYSVALCQVSNYDRARAAGHNHRINRYLASRRLRAARQQP